MKKLLLLIAAAVMVNYAFSQDIIDPPPLNIDFTDTTYFQRDIDGFIKGWNWFTIGSKLDIPLDMNLLHIGTKRFAPNRYQEGQLLTYKMDGINYGVKSNSTLQAMAIQFDPCLQITDPNHFIPKYKDTLGAVFGFLNRKFDDIGDTVSFNTDPENYHRYILRKDNLTTNTKVLWNPFPGDKFHLVSTDADQTVAYNNTYYLNQFGRRWYISINLRSLDSIETSDDTPVLKIKLPYRLCDGSTTGFIKFSSIPDPSSNAVQSIFGRDQDDFRGLTRELMPTPSVNDSTEFIITREMLNVNGVGSPNRDITISAYFTTSSTFTSPAPNPDFKWDWDWTDPRNAIKIDSLGIDVWYMNGAGLDVAIDWIRIQTPHARDYFSGACDNEIRDSINNTITRLAAANKRFKIFRFYAMDEFWLPHWQATRYFNKLVDGLANSEINHTYYPDRLKYVTELKEFWDGQSISMSDNVAAPFLRTTNRTGPEYNTFRPEVFNYYNGYFGWHNADSQHLQDTTKSLYETNLIKDSAGVFYYHLPIDIPDSNFFEWSPTNGMFVDNGTLYNTEKELFKKYQNPHHEFLFSNDRWIGQIWAGCGDWHLRPYDIVALKETGTSRPLTGEELRYMTNLHICLGAKGLMYWLGDTNIYITDNKVSTVDSTMCLGMASFIGDDQTYNNLPDGQSLLYSDLIGGDYITEDDPSTFDDYINSNIEWNTLGIDSDHIYVGRESERTELFKLHRWIDNNEDELMRMRLVSWLGKGFKRRILTSPDYDSLILNEFIDIDQIKTRPLGRVDQYYKPEYEQSATIDSGFYDITLLRDQDHPDISDSVFYIAVVNRRTDPLILMEDGEDEYLEFIPTGRFDELVRSAPTGSHRHFGPTQSGDFHYWRTLWWKRLGCREITLPFNFRNNNDTTEYCLLKIKGLDKPQDFLWDDDWWTDDLYRDNIDTVIGQNRQLSINLLPGEAKILRIEVLHPPAKVAGELSYPNQCKLISFPYHEYSYPDYYYTGRESDSIYYHMVYFKHDTINNEEVNRVYYRRSEKIGKNNSTENIIWQDEVCISDTIIKPDESILVNQNCAYPSIVVRKYDDTVRAFIVYSCGDSSSAEGYNGYMICQTVLKGINNTNIDDMTVGRIIFGGGQGEDLTEYGTPVINVSDGVNFYAWADSLGIIAGYSIPSDRAELEDTTIISYEGVSGEGEYPVTRHPSLNVYSKEDEGEDNCALVWQENGSQFDYPQIFYTRLRVDDNTNLIYNYFKTGEPIFKISKTNLFSGEQNIMPSVIRSPFQYDFSPLYVAPNRVDMIVWESYNTVTPMPNHRIGKRIISLFDYENDPVDTWESGVEHIQNNCFKLGDHIYCWDSHMYDPNITHGPSITRTYDNNLNYWELLARGDIILGFRGKSNMLQEIDMSYHSSLFTLRQVRTSINRNIRDIGEGEQLHLYNSPEVYNDNSIWKGHRIFENGPAEINTSSQYFYRKYEEEANITEGLIGYITNVDQQQARYLITIPELDGSGIEMHLPYIYNQNMDSTLTRIDTDTLYSTHFQIGSNSVMEFKCFGFDTTDIEMYLYREADNVKINIPLPINYSDTAGVYRIFLINGQDMYYKLFFVNRDTLNYTYGEDAYVGGLPVDDTLTGRMTNKIYPVVDLSLKTYKNEENRLKLLLYPNPANQMIHAAVYMPETLYTGDDQRDRNSRIVLKMYSSMGKELYSKEVKPGETITIPTSDLSNGTYFLKAEEKVGTWGIEPVGPTTKPFVIER